MSAVVEVTDKRALLLHAEQLSIGRRRIEGDTVRVTSVTHQHEHLIDETLTHERVEIERVAIGQVVDVAPPVREEGDVTIIPVVEEVVVVERRLILKEEIHMRRVQHTEQHRETVTLRRQEALITRVGPAAATELQAQT